MDKTVSISLGGFSFIIDEIAFRKLKIYLEDVRISLHGTEGIDDIIEDVEIRIAELFRDRIKFREVVNDDDVDFVIATMGHPNQYRVEDEEEVVIKTTINERVEAKQERKKLFRDPDDKIISGLSAGLAHYFGLDPWAIRAVWLVFGFLGIFTAGVSFLLVLSCYIILLILVPKANTTSEKLQMYGKPANIETLKKNAQQASEVVVSGSRELSNKLGSLFAVFGKILFWFVGIILVLIGISFIIGGFAIFFTSITGLPVELFGYIVEESWMKITSKVLGGILMIIPGILITILGVKCFVKVSVNKSVIISSIVAWFIALFSLIGISISTASKFRSSVENRKEQVFNIQNDTLNVSFKDHNLGTYRYESFDDLDQLIDENGNLIIPVDDVIRLKESTDNNFKVEVKYSSKGGNASEARKNLESIKYNYTIEGNNLILDEFIKIPKGGKFRDQKISVTLFIPANKFVNVREADEAIVYDREDDYKYHHRIKNNVFVYNGKKIICTNCENDDNEYNYEELESFEVITDSAKISINENGIQIKGKDGSVDIKANTKNNNQINYKDDTDNINIDYGSN